MIYTSGKNSVNLFIYYFHLREVASNYILLVNCEWFRV